MAGQRPQPPRPDRLRTIRRSFGWIDHRFLREGFDVGLTRLEKLFYFVLVAVSNRDGVSFYSDGRLSELLDVRYPHELTGARNELVARDLIAFENGLYQVLELPSRPLPPGQYVPACKNFARPEQEPPRRSSARGPEKRGASNWKSLQELLGRQEPEENNE